VLAFPLASSLLVWPPLANRLLADRFITERFFADRFSLADL
jgi:hypothetical protein